MRALRRLHSLLQSSSARAFAIAAHPAPAVPAVAGSRARLRDLRGVPPCTTAAAARPSGHPSHSTLGALTRRIHALRVSPGLERYASPAPHLRAWTRVAARASSSEDPTQSSQKESLRSFTSTPNASAPPPPDGVYGSSHKRPMGKSKSGDAFVTQGLGSRAYLRVIGLGTDTDGAETSPSVLLFTDAKRYTFNVGEGFQRFAVEHGVNVRRLSHVFLTRVCGRTAGGLTGMLLTIADDTYESTESSPTLHVHGPPRTDRLMAAVDTLVGGRGVRTVPRPFPQNPSAGQASHAPALDDGIVTVTPVVVDPNPRGPLGPLNTLGKDSTASTDKSSGDSPRPAKRAKGTFGAFTFGANASIPAEEAESVCYHVQLCGMPGGSLFIYVRTGD